MFKTTYQVTNEERTAEYSDKWDTEKTLKVLIDKESSELMS